MAGREVESDRPHGMAFFDRLADGLRRTADALERATKAAMGKPEAGRDALRRVLHADHEEVLQLFDWLGDPDRRDVAATWRRLRDLLRAHSRAEDEIIYTRLVDEPLTRDATLHARQEHAELDRLVDEVDELAPGSDAFHERLGELHHVVRHHVTEEEGNLLVEAARVLSESERDALAERFRELEAILESSAAGSTAAEEVHRRPLAG